MFVVTIETRLKPKSFDVVIYDAARQELKRYPVPLGVAAPFANRIVREKLHIADSLPEPWYGLDARPESQLQREALPEGPTSLYGGRYIPDTTGPIISMHPEAPIRYFEVSLFDFQRELYRGIYTMDDIFLHGAHFLLRNGIRRGQLPAEKGPYYYAVIPSTRLLSSVSSDLVPEDAYKSEGIFRLPPRAKETTPRIQFRPIPQPPLSERDPSTFSVIESHGKGEAQAGRVFIPADLYDDLCCHLSLSKKKEEGGYILGNVYRLAGSPENEDAPEFRWLLEVTDLLMAEDTVGSSAVLLFTGDSWSKVSRRRDRDYPTRRLIGWFHTHLFPATDSFGLSG
ncbi:MAG TPA: hypothetical protein VGN34_03365, partial [Ktedonobacteraceae bacterium]